MKASDVCVVREKWTAIPSGLESRYNTGPLTSRETPFLQLCEFAPLFRYVDGARKVHTAILTLPQSGAGRPPPAGAIEDAVRCATSYELTEGSFCSPLMGDAVADESSDTMPISAFIRKVRRC